MLKNNAKKSVVFFYALSVRVGLMKWKRN